jgi:hypothetical protein
MATTSFDAVPTSDTIIFDYADDFVSVTLPAMQVEENPENYHNSHTNIYCIHYLSFLYDYLFMQTSESEKYFIEM